MKKTKADIKTILTLFATFFKIGLFTFGGGYAMIALIEREVVEKKHWLTAKEMVDLIAIAESTPGVIALNSATFVGAKISGFWGSLAASIAVMLPSIIIISAISTAIEKFGANKYVQWAFWGIRSAVAALILNAVFKVYKSVDKSLVFYIVMGVSFALAVLSIFNIIPVDIVFIIIASALFGILWGYFRRRKAQKAAYAGDSSQSDPLNKPTEPDSSVSDPETSQKEADK